MEFLCMTDKAPQVLIQLSNYQDGCILEKALFESWSPITFHTPDK